ncbi:DUF1015 domain-containing protein [Gracilimonas sp.]|uniref:DUF1015 domain-containing protein n=1 Tax=Gracilimonas sp. TaxID=1974203 RepID=UPI0028728A05|nr:DUF1015 family protein [Gracilimonas sp.]
MAIVKPFKAWRPNPEFAKDIASVPYDVIDTNEARNLAKGKPNSFLHIIRPEIDVPANTSIYDPKVYQKGRENLSELLSSEFFTQEESESLYIYCLEMGERSQTGIFGCISVEDYENEVILKHELTRPKKEDDRTKHIVTQKAHAEPVMMTFKDTEETTTFMNEYMSSNKPIYDITFEDDVRHVIWKVADYESLTSSFNRIPKLYIADGHHRCASAARAAKEFASQNPNHTGDESYNFFPAVLFPVEQMEILAYNRIIYSAPDDFLSTLQKEFKVTKNAKPAPRQKGTVALYFEEKWFGLNLKEPVNDDPASKLDISLLQDQVLEPFLGIKDQRTDPNIDFVGGIRGTEELEKIVDNGEAALAISMYPTSIEELLDVSDAGQLMPPKSTWFEPKLRSGFLVHTF